MSDLTRRSFLTGTAGAAAGAALWSGPIKAAAAGTAPGEQPPASSSEEVAAAEAAEAAEGVVLYVRSAGGDVVVMADDTSIEVRDPALLRAVARTLKSAKG
jgi:hypothetical protein